MRVVDRLIGLASPAAALRRGIRLSERSRAAAAFALLTRSAKAGIPEAEYRVARCYLEGAGVPSSRTEGARWLERAARHGYVEAQALLGALCVHGLANGTNGAGGEINRADPLFAAEEAHDPDFATALKWARQAAEAGDAKGQALLGYVLSCGPEALRAPEEAHRWYERSAAQGCPEGCLGYALSLAPHTRDEEGRREVARHLECAAEAELPSAIYLLAVLTEQGVGVARDNEEAARWLRASGEGADQGARVDLGNLVLDGAGEPDDPARVARWFEEAAIAGDLAAAFNLGVCLDKGLGVARDEQQAAHWLRRAAENIAEAQYMYGRMLAAGRGVVPDLPAARAWLARAAGAGMAEAQVALAEMTINGRGGPRDPAAAHELFERAAAQSHSGAIFALGALHAGGHELPADWAAAQRWFHAAAERGHGQAQLMLGRYLASGAAGEPDPARARIWLERAVAQGVEEA